MSCWWRNQVTARGTCIVTVTAHTHKHRYRNNKLAEEKWVHKSFFTLCLKFCVGHFIVSFHIFTEECVFFNMLCLQVFPSHPSSLPSSCVRAKCMCIHALNAPPQECGRLSMWHPKPPQYFQYENFKEKCSVLKFSFGIAVVNLLQFGWKKPLFSEEIIMPTFYNFF